MWQIWQATFVSASRFAIEKKEENIGNWKVFALHPNAKNKFLRKQKQEHLTKNSEFWVFDFDFATVSERNPEYSESSNPSWSCRGWKQPS